MATDAPGHAPPAKSQPARGEQLKLAAAGALVALAVAFALLNLDEVDVNWIFGTHSTPLIVVIAVSFLLGVGADRALAMRRRRVRRGG